MYVKHGGINATVPRDLKPEELTVEQAVSLLAERAAKGGGKKPKAVARQEDAAGRRPTTPATRRKAKQKTAKKKTAAPRQAPKAQGRRELRRAPGPMAKGRVPTRDELLAFIKESATPVGKREIARAYGLKGDQRIELKQLLRDLRDRGDIAARPRQDIQGSTSTD